MAKRSGLAWKVCYAVLIPALMIGLLSCGSDNTPAPSGSVTPIGQATPMGGIVVTPVPIQSNSATEVATTTVVATTAAATTPSPAPGTNSLTVPKYPNFKAAATGAPLEARLTTELVGSKTASNTLQLFTTDSSFEEVVKYYDKILGDAGYVKAGNQSVSSVGTLKIKNGEIIGYALGGSNPNRVALVNLGIVTDNFISQLNSAELTAFKLNVGDHLVGLINNVPPGLG